MKNGKFVDNMTGRRYYTYDAQNKLKIIRIKRVYNLDKISVYDESMGVDTGFIISLKSLKEVYTPLAPDITYAFYLVQTTENKNTRDIMIYGTRYKDIEKADVMPYVVCRQMVKSPIGDSYVTPMLGNCVSRDTVLSPNEFANQFIIHSIIQKGLVHAYLSDTPDDIIKLINKSFLRKMNKFLKETHDKLKSKFTGINTNIASLLENLDFWKLADMGFKVLNVPFAIYQNSLSEDEQKFIEAHLAYHIRSVDVIPYDKDIDLGKIQTDYIIIRDSNHHTFLVNYIKSKFNMEAISEVLSPSEIAQILPSKK